MMKSPLNLKLACDIENLVTSKDLKKKVTLEVAQQQSKLIDKLHSKPFWIWDITEHKRDHWTAAEGCN